MRSRCLWLALAAVGACASTPVANAEGPRELRFGRDVLGVSVTDLRAFDAGTGVGAAALKVTPPTTRLSWGKVEAELTVENPTASPVTVLVRPAGGAFPYGGESPFFFRLTSGARYAGHLYPPEPPLPMRITFPAHSRVTFPATFDLGPWEWKGPVDAVFTWMFVLMGGTSPTGTLTVHLPAK